MWMNFNGVDDNDDGNGCTNNVGATHINEKHNKKKKKEEEESKDRHQASSRHVNIEHVDDNNEQHDTLNVTRESQHSKLQYLVALVNGFIPGEWKI